ncbi:hypothetical protein P2318_20270 [Myxococcaceae bacterium GXIMD 01537]
MFLTNHYRDVFPRWRRDAGVPSLLNDLTRLMTHPPDDAFIAMGIGYKESALMQLCNREEREPEFLRGYCPAPARLIPLAKDHFGKGFCQFAAPWLAKYLGQAHARDTGLKDIGAKLGNHAFVKVPHDGGEIIVDGTWRQFAGPLGIANPRDLPTILVADSTQIGTVLRGLGAQNNEKSRTLVRFYGGDPAQLQ